MQRFLLTLYFITTGWVPLFYGIYMANSNSFAVAMAFLLISFCGFRQVYDSFNYQELIKEKEEKIQSQRKKLTEMVKDAEQKNKLIARLSRDYYDD